MSVRHWWTVCDWAGGNINRKAQSRSELWIVSRESSLLVSLSQSFPSVTSPQRVVGDWVWVDCADVKWCRRLFWKNKEKGGLITALLCSTTGQAGRNRQCTQQASTVLLRSFQYSFFFFYLFRNDGFWSYQSRILYKWRRAFVRKADGVARATIIPVDFPSTPPDVMRISVSWTSASAFLHRHHVVS